MIWIWCDLTLDSFHHSLQMINFVILNTRVWTTYSNLTIIVLHECRRTLELFVNHQPFQFEWAQCKIHTWVNTMLFLVCAISLNYAIPLLTMQLARICMKFSLHLLSVHTWVLVFNFHLCSVSTNEVCIPGPQFIRFRWYIYGNGIVRNLRSLCFIQGICYNQVIVYIVQYIVIVRVRQW